MGICALDASVVKVVNRDDALHRKPAFPVSDLDDADARGTQPTRIKNDGVITGVFTDALTAQHGLTGQ